MTLHCTFEHFEEQNDSNFIKEVERLLKPGGKCLIIPLYISNTFLNLTDPSLFSFQMLRFDEKATVQKWFGLLNRFTRIYSPEELCNRVLNILKVARPTIYWIEKAPWLPITERMRFALLLEKD